MNIIENTQDPEISQSLLTKQATHTLFATVLTVIFVSAFAVSIAVPHVAQAQTSFFGFLHTVFADIAKEKRISIPHSNDTALRAATHVDPNPAKGGADIEVVDGKALIADGGSIGKSVAPQNKDAISLYVVRSGDSLSQVARIFGVSVNTIVWANNLRSARSIKPGQVLVILPVSGIRHTIKKGETLASIAKKYKGDADEIAVFNGLTDKKLVVGTEVIIPGGELSRPKRSYTRRGSRRTSPLRGAGGPSYPGYYTYPVPGGVLTQGLHGYNAVDIGAPRGTPIVAAASGTVILSRSGGWNGGYGNYVVIKHDNGTQTLYAHASRNIVGVGQYVVKGQVIAYVGSTGKSTGPHVHFEVRGAKNPFGR